MKFSVSSGRRAQRLIRQIFTIQTFRSFRRNCYKVNSSMENSVWTMTMSADS